nr:MAG: hypothetical protein [Bacteriophage sp.]UVX68936.1 MAG: hypothetical protein [Bacteriophage sp.]UVY06774.1 MAG: hypothetical protein [Bacteriophage sp.]UWF86578.1 MAG: hypothetical protein [Bacteriophage sp.]UWG85692.1 MAG: hypothetical protein [Bacteriophage sp.]
MIKAVLLIGGKRYDVTDHLKNWEDVEISAKRKDIGGVVRSFSNKFEFVKGAYDLLEAEYLSNYTKASAILVIGVLNDSWGYNEKFRCKLDFSTYQSDGYTISINAIDDSVASIINANKSQVYDIPVSELKEDTLYYDRIKLLNKSTMYITPNFENELMPDYDRFMALRLQSRETLLPLAYGEISTPVKGVMEVYDVGMDIPYDNAGKTGYFALCLVDKIEINLRIRMVVDLLTTAVTSLHIRHMSADNKLKSDKAILLSKDGSSAGVTSVDESLSYAMRDGDRLIAYILCVTSIGEDIDEIIKISRDYDLYIDYSARNKPVNIDAFSPKKLLSSLLSRMGVSLSGDIVSGSMPIPWMMAAESVRGIKDAKVHTSFSKFCDFAKALLGYDYEILDNSVRFRHMNDFFVNETKELDHVSNMELSVDESLIYSGVEIGFDKQDYDEINGRDEFHFKSSFSTGLDIKDNILSLISPYRADCYGLEFLANERDEESKDTDSDNDIFIVHARKDGDRLVLVREENGGAIYAVTGVLFPDTIFNASYSPRNMLLVNKERLGICTDYLSFTASDGNSSISIGGVSETLPISLPVNDRRIRIDKVSLETPGLSPFPGNYRGKLSFSYAGRSYEGWVSEITEKIGKYQTASYSLILSKIT